MSFNIVVKESGKELGIILSCDILPSVSEILEVREGVGISLFRVDQVVHELAKVSGRFQTHQVSRVVLVVRRLDGMG